MPYSRLEGVGCLRFDHLQLPAAKGLVSLIDCFPGGAGGYGTVGFDISHLEPPSVQSELVQTMRCPVWLLDQSRQGVPREIAGQPRAKKEREAGRIDRFRLYSFATGVAGFIIPHSLSSSYMPSYEVLGTRCTLTKTRGSICTFQTKRPHSLFATVRFVCKIKSDFIQQFLALLMQSHGSGQCSERTAGQPSSPGFRALKSE